MPALETAIVRLINTQGITIGTGFVVSDKGLIATCAHVVRDAGTIRGGLINFSFLGDDTLYEATAVPEWWTDPDKEDVAILQLVREMPAHAQALLLGTSYYQEMHSFVSRGFRYATTALDGLPAEGRIQGHATIQWRGYERDALVLHTGQVKKGMSGAPVWDTRTHRVVGMVNFAHDTDPNLAFAIPSETLKEACSKLVVSDICPYRGLEVFTVDDTDFFFGRKVDVKQLEKRIVEDDVRLIMLLGASGSGKSSLVQAGLIPRLLVRQTTPQWDYKLCQPGENPFAAVQEAFVGIASYPTPPPIPDLTQILTTWSKQHPGTHLLLVIDQFEELFTLTKEESLRHAFAAQLANVPYTLPVTILLTLRNDFYHYLDQEAAPLLDRLNQRHGRYDVGRELTPEQLQAIIEEPAKAVGLQFADGLVKRIIVDVAEAGGKRGTSQATALPLLEFTLTRLWETRYQGKLTHDAYKNEVQGVAGGLNRWAETALNELEVQGKERQRLSQRLFTDLVFISEDNPQQPITRRFRMLSELARTPGERSAIHGLVGFWADKRLLITDGDDENPTVTIIHDALLSGWNTLKQWLEQDRDFIIWRQRLQSSLRQWQASDHDKGWLLHDTPLAEAKDWLAERSSDFGQAEREFVQQSLALQDKEAEEREAQRERKLELIRERQIEAEARRQAEAEARRIAEDRAREAQHAAQAAAEATAKLRRRLVYVVVTLAMAMIAAILAIDASVRASQQQAIADTAADALATEVVIRTTKEAEAENRAAEIQSAFLANVARQALDSRNPDLAVALALHANEVVEAASLQTQSVLADAIYAADTIYNFSGHSNWVLSTAFSPDGRIVLSGSADGSLILWDVEERRELYRFNEDGHADWVWGVAMNAAGTRAASGSSDTRLILWDINRRQKINEIEVDSGVLDVAFHPVEDQVLAGLENGNIVLWDVADEMSLLRFTGHNDKVTSVTFNPDGRQALSASEDKTLLLWDVNSGSITHTHTFTEHNDLVLSAAFSPVDNGRTILSGAANGSLILWDAQSGEIIRYFQHPLDIWIYDIAFSPDGKTALTSGSDNSLQLWDVESGALIRRFDGHTGEVQSVAFSPDGQTAISGARDNTLRLWSLERGQESQASKDDFSHEVWSVAFAPDGEAIWVGLADGSLLQLDVEKLEQINSFKDHFAQVSSLFLIGDSVLTGSHDQTLSLRDLTQDVTLPLRNGHSAAVRSVAFNAEDHIALSGGGDHGYRITLWNTETGQAVGRLSGHTNWVTSLAFDPTGQQALSGSHDHTMILWDVETRQQIQRFQGHTGWLLSVDMSPDGETALSGSEDGSLILWDVESGQPISQLYGHTDWVLQVSFSPDGRMALSSSKDGTLILWNVESGNQLRRFVGHRDWVWGAAFSPDGRAILSGSADGSIRLWPIQPLLLDELVPWLRANRYVRELTCSEREQFRVSPCN